MRQKITGNWNAMRLLRLITGMVAVGLGVIQSEVLIGFAGVFLVLMSLLNLGCSSTSDCPVTFRQRDKNTNL
jgi:hypothetical protein